MTEAPKPDSEPRQERNIRILVADPHPLLREGLCMHLERHPGMSVVAEAADGDEALRLALETKPNVVVMAMKMPGRPSTEVTREVREHLPSTHILILTAFDNPEYVHQVVKAGAEGYMLKDASPQELVRAIAAVNASEAYFCPSAARALLDKCLSQEAKPPRGDGLTPRETEVVTLIAQGLTNKEVAAELGVSVRTIETHRERSMRKLDLHTAAGLTRYAIAQGLVEAE